MIGIVCFWDRCATPYLAKYEELLNGMKLAYEVLLWNRTPSEDAELISKSANEININISCNGTKLKKLRAFFRWRSIARRIIKENKYDHLIVLSTVPAVLLYGTLLNDYKDNYLFDIRDYTLENNKIFRHVVMRLINNSVLTSISSKGYMRWLNPSSKIMVNHNITVNEEIEPCIPKLIGKKSINFAFVGNVRLDSQTEALLLALKDESRIEQHYYGRIIPNCKIREIKEEYNIDNLYFHGAFTVSDKPQIFADVDLINCVYANAEREEEIPLGDSTPLPNRLYDSLTFYRPIVASKGTYLAELVEQYHLGCCINGFDAAAKYDILKYVDTFDESEFISGCNALKSIVIKEEKEYLKMIKMIFKDWK